MNFWKYLALFCASAICARGQILGGVVDVAGSVVESLGEGDLASVAGNVTSLVTDGFKRIKFVLMANDRNVTFDQDNITSVLADASFDNAKPTLLYMHGYSESETSESVNTVREAIQCKGTHNFLLVDYSVYSGTPYATAVLNLPGASEAVGNATDQLVQAGLWKKGLWLVGHSLGGQMSAIVSRKLDFKPTRITALDPARPGFEMTGFPNLTRDDAYMVDVIHTDAGNFGFEESCGHVDFWPNSGHPVQPGCIVRPIGGLFCSHQRSWRYFAESVDDEQALPAVKCGSWSDFQAGKCPVNATNLVYLGYRTPAADVEGDFFLKTTDESPFHLGLAGVQVNTSADAEKCTAPAGIVVNVTDAKNLNASSRSTDGFFSGILHRTTDFFGSIF